MVNQMKQLSEYPQEVTVLYALQNVTRDQSHSVDVEEFYQSVRLESCFTYDWNKDWNKVNSHLKSYSIYSWLCTDTIVGFYAVYLDDELVAQTFKKARKSSLEIKFISKEAAIKVRDFLLECMQSDDDEQLFQISETLNNKISVLSSNYFSNQQHEKEGFFGGLACTVMNNCKFNSSESTYTYSGLRVRFYDNDEIMVIRCEDFKTLIKVNF